MDIHLHIDRLVLHDVDLRTRDHGLLRMAIAAELGRLVQPRADAAREPPAAGNAAELGRRIARSIHAAASGLPGPRNRS